MGIASVSDSSSPNTAPVKNPTNPCSDPGSYPTYTAAAGPLVGVTWGEFETYNEDCPNLSCTGGYGAPYAATGCVPTAGAMIFQYWAHNPVITGENLPNASYNFTYSTMPTTSGNSQVAQLMYLLGEQMQSTYGCGSGIGTSTNSEAFQYAIYEMLDFPFPIWAPYTNTNMTCYDSITADFNAKEPICFSAKDSVNGGHFWVCDGYSQSWGEECYAGQLNDYWESYLHMNWGWHEIDDNPPTNDPDFNGYYDYDNWEIIGGGPSNENLDFHYANWVLKEISPQ